MLKHASKCIQAMEVPKGECYFTGAWEYILEFHHDFLEVKRTSERPKNGTIWLTERLEGPKPWAARLVGKEYGLEGGDMAKRISKCVDKRGAYEKPSPKPKIMPATPFLLKIALCVLFEKCELERG